MRLFLYTANIFISMKSIIVKLLKEELKKLSEEIVIPIEVGDEILGGKFKNKKIVVKTIGKNENGDITINGKPLLKFRITKDIKEDIISQPINDIEDDDLYDNILTQADTLSKSGDISFGSAELFGVLYDDETNELIGATWLETSGNFTFHIIIKPEYRGKGFAKILVDDLMTKYQQMKSYKGDNYKIMVNVVNDTFADFLTKKYGLKKIEDNGHGGVIMTNESETKDKLTYQHFVDGDRLTINAFLGRTNIGNVILQVHNNGYSNFEDVMDELEYEKLFRTNKFVEIEQLRVGKDFRGSGYAKELMIEALKTIKKHGYTVAYLNASPLGAGGLDLPELITLYKKFGFVEIQHDLNYGDDNREMILHL